MVQKILTQLENLAKNYQLRYMSSRRTTEIIAEGYISFHPHDCQNTVMLEYKKRLVKLGLKNDMAFFFN